MIDVERQKSNTEEAEVLRFGAENLQLLKFEKKVERRGCPIASSRHHPEPTRCARDEAYPSQGLEWMQMEEISPNLLSQVMEEWCTDDTTLIEKVEFKNYCMSWRCLDSHTKF